MRCGWCSRCVRSWALSVGTVTRLARQLGYGEESLRRWVAQAEVDAGSRAGLTVESEELKRLRHQNRELRRANEILQRAAVFFGAELDG